jgi:hypothetical protein
MPLPFIIAGIAGIGSAIAGAGAAAAAGAVAIGASTGAAAVVGTAATIAVGTAGVALAAGGLLVGAATVSVLWDSITESYQVTVIRNREMQEKADELKRLDTVTLTKMIQEGLNSPHPKVIIFGANADGHVIAGVKYEGDEVDSELRNRFGSLDAIIV